MTARGKPLSLPEFKFNPAGARFLPSFETSRGLLTSWRRPGPRAGPLGGRRPAGGLR